jgi:glycosyltransferase involved in cell wall biosynthesis
MLVTILVNNYNYASFLRRAIDSALSQNYSDVQVVVVDDGSNDGSREIIAGYGKKITPILKANGGQSSAFNAGFEACQGELICFLDADDEFLPEKVQRVVDQFRELPNVWYFHQLQFVDKSSQPLGGSPVSRHRTGKHDFRADFIRGKDKFWMPATSGLSFSRHLLSRLLPMPDNIRITSDNYLKFSAIAMTPGVFMAERLSLQRIHGNNAYTLKYDPRLRAETNIVTGKAISAQHPELRPIGNRLVAKGLGAKYRAGGGREEIRRELSQYVASLPLREKFDVYLRLLYNALLPSKMVESNTSLASLQSRAL